VVDAARAEPLLGDAEAGPLLAQQVGARHAAGVVEDLGVAEHTLAGVTHDVDVAHQVEAGRVGGHQDHAGPLMRRRLGVGHRHDHRQGRPVGGGGVPLLAVDDVVVTVADGSGRHHHRVRARHLGLGHRETGADLAGDQRSQPAGLLRLGAVLVEDLDVAGVGGVAAEDVVAQRRDTQRLGDQAVVDQPEAHAAVLPRVVRRPEAHLPDRPAHLLDLGLEARERLGEEEPLERQHLPAHELVDHAEGRLDLLR
jgi:hypothetical protein